MDANIKKIYDIITKLPESGVLCDNITEFGVAEDHLSPWFCNGICNFSNIFSIKNYYF